MPHVICLKKSSVGTSQFVEQLKFKSAMEAELVKTISGFNNVKGARVHLAIPKKTSFFTRSASSSASVFLDVASGQELTSETVLSIVQLVASSVPELSTRDVSVVDQYGRLLSESGEEVLSLWPTSNCVIPSNWSNPTKIK